MKPINYYFLSPPSALSNVEGILRAMGSVARLLRDQGNQIGADLEDEGGQAEETSQTGAREDGSLASTADLGDGLAGGDDRGATGRASGDGAVLGGVGGLGGIAKPSR